MVDKFKELKYSDISKLREYIYKTNKGKCPILNIDIPSENTVLDHNHKKNGNLYSKNKGTIRNVIDFRVNLLLGKIENNFIRYGLSEYNLPDILRAIADYIESEPYEKDGYYYIHPTEINKKTLSKRNYNKVKKLYLEDNKHKKRFKAFPSYPKSGKPTKPLIKLFNKYNIDLYNL